MLKIKKKIPMRAFLIRFDDFSRKNCIQRLEVGRGGLYEEYGGKCEFAASFREILVNGL